MALHIVWISAHFCNYCPQGFLLPYIPCSSFIHPIFFSLFNRITCGMPTSAFQQSWNRTGLLVFLSLENIFYYFIHFYQHPCQGDPVSLVKWNWIASSAPYNCMSLFFCTTLAQISSMSADMMGLLLPRPLSLLSEQVISPSLCQSNISQLLWKRNVLFETEWKLNLARNL